MPIARFPLASNIESRTNSTAKDARLVNALVEGKGEDKQIVKRPGLQSLSLSPAISAGQGQGMFSWNNYLIAGNNNSIYFISGLATTSVLGSITGVYNPLSFCSVANDDKLGFHNGSNIYTINKGATGSPPTFVGGIGISGVVSSVTITEGGGYYGYDTSCTVVSGATTTINYTSVPHDGAPVVGQGVSFSGTTLPTGISSGTTYQVASTGVNSFTINTATAGGGAGSAVATSTSGSGVTFSLSPTVTFDSSPGTTAKGVAVLFGHQVASVIITVAGTGYTSAPTVTFGTVWNNTQHESYNNTTPSNFPVYIGTSLSRINGANGFLSVSKSTVTITPSDSGSGSSPAYTPLQGTFYVNSDGTLSNFTFTSAPSSWSSVPSIYVTITPISTTATGNANMASSGITGPFAPGMCYLDNKCYIMGTNGNVYDSATDNPASWSGTYLNASSDPDGGKALAKHLNYLVAFGEWSTEFLYDAGNPTGSPLAVNQSAKLEIGCANGYSVAKADQTIIWVGQSLTEGRSVFLLDGMAPVKISTRYIEKYLNADSMINVRAFCMKLAGHTLYVLTLKDSNVTFVFDLDEQHWSQWTSQSGGTETYFTPTAFDGNVEYNAGLYLQDESNGNIYKMDSSYTSDNGNGIYVRSVTPILDSGTKKRKFYRRLEAVGDVVASTLSVRHSDDDYTTWSSYRTMDLSKSRPVLYQNGQARRRAYEVLHTANTALRLDALEIEFDSGELGEEQK